MGSNAEIFATVKSPSKTSSWRKAKGFSLEEVKQSGYKLAQLKELNIHIDNFRKSAYPENIEALKSLKIAEKDKEKRKPFIAKEKKRTPFKPKKEKSRAVREKAIKKITKVPVVKEKPKPVKKEKTKPLKKRKTEIVVKGTPLTELPGLGAATAKKFNELGVNTVEELCMEDPNEIAPLIKGVSLDRCKNWIEEGKDLIK